MTHCHCALLLLDDVSVITYTGGLHVYIRMYVCVLIECHSPCTVVLTLSIATLLLIVTNLCVCVCVCVCVRACVHACVCVRLLLLSSCFLAVAHFSCCLKLEGGMTWNSLTLTGRPTTAIP